jgi:hypothetical protein
VLYDSSPVGSGDFYSPLESGKDGRAHADDPGHLAYGFSFSLSPAFEHSDKKHVPFMAQSREGRKRKIKNL